MKTGSGTDLWPLKSSRHCEVARIRSSVRVRHLSCFQCIYWSERLLICFPWVYFVHVGLIKNWHHIVKTSRNQKIERQISSYQLQVDRNLLSLHFPCSSLFLVQLVNFCHSFLRSSIPQTSSRPRGPRREVLSTMELCVCPPLISPLFCCPRFSASLFPSLLVPLHSFPEEVMFFQRSRACVCHRVRRPIFSPPFFLLAAAPSIPKREVSSAAKPSLQSLSNPI